MFKKQQWGAARYPCRVPACSGGRRGTSFVEITLAMSILLVVLLSFSLVLGSSINVSDSEGEQSLAREAARTMLEELGGTPFDQVFVRYNVDPGDDPAGVPAPGAAFDVEGLDPLTDDPDGRVGEILFPTDDLVALREDVGDPAFGMPRDINADGAVDGFDHTSDYALLPVLVRVQWLGRGGRNAVELKTILKER